ncbi:MAG: conjugative transposon protein TraN [Bacteroidia bacterium]
MKKLIVLLIANLFGIAAFAQGEAVKNYESIVPEELSIAVGKTTNIIYPFAIKSVDRGSREILVQKAKGLENILQVKAGRECFTETNLTVITTDGKLYSYNLHYDEFTSQLNLDYTNGKTVSTHAEAFNDAVVKELSGIAAGADRNTYGIKDKANGVKLVVDGLFIHENVLFFRIKIENKTNINYDIGQLRLFIKDQKKSRRTASQEIEVRQLSVYNPISVITGPDEDVTVIAVPKFTIPDKKELILQVMEKDGGRHLEVPIKNNKIIQSQPI